MKKLMEEVSKLAKGKKKPVKKPAPKE